MIGSKYAMASKLLLPALAMLALIPSSSSSSLACAFVTMPSTPVPPTMAGRRQLPYKFMKTSSSSEKENEYEEESFLSAVARGWQPERGTFSGIVRRGGCSSASSVSGHPISAKGRAMSRARQLSLSMVEDRNAVIPDGGLSPCVIKVVGVGGGGCNAVSIDTHWKLVLFIDRKFMVFIF